MPVPAPAPAAPPEAWRLPHAYGEDRAVLLVRDPWWLYAYWEVTPERDARAREQVARDGRSLDKTVLRVYDITDTPAAAPHRFFDIELNFFANNWYIDVGAPDREWMIEIGLRTREGAFYPLVRSNVVRTPRFGISDVLDEEWMLPDELYWKILGLSGGFGLQRSSMDIREFLDKYLRRLGASENSARAVAADPLAPHAVPDLPLKTA